VLLQLEEMKKARGLSVDDGTAAPDRPLAEILAERKKAKQDAFDDQWKQMKTGAARTGSALQCDGAGPPTVALLSSLPPRVADWTQAAH
jgi:hypothetical protein